MMKGLYHILVCEKGNSELGGYLLSPDQAKAGNQALEQPVAFLQMDGAGGWRRAVATGRSAGREVAWARRRRGFRSGRAVSGRNRKASRRKTCVRCAQAKPNVWPTSNQGLRCYQCNRLSTIIHLRTHYFWTPQHEREPVGRLVRLHQANWPWCVATCPNSVKNSVF